jgi:hypothetical protein
MYFERAGYNVPEGASPFRIVHSVKEWSYNNFRCFIHTYYSGLVICHLLSPASETPNTQLEVPCVARDPAID